MIKEILQLDEGRTLEFKENTKAVSHIVKTVISFANTAGGLIVVGIRDTTKEVVGIDNVLGEEEKLANAIADSIEPLIIPDILIKSFRDRDLLIIKVPHVVGPYYLKSVGKEKGTYVRLGSTNRLADSETLDTLKLLSKNMSFDELPCIEANVASLNQQAIAKSFDTQTPPNLLNLRLVSTHLGQDYPTNGAVLLFGLHHEQYFPDAIIRCVRFQGTDKSEIIDQVDITTNLISSIEQVIQFIERHSSTALKIGRIKHQEYPEYPPIAIREAVINTIVHTDYSLKGSSIHVHIFQDRIEITNPGTLPFGQTMASALSGISMMRNHLMGRIFRKLKLIEKLGSGLQRIIKTYAAQTSIAPKFEEINTHFRVTLYSLQVPVPPANPWEKYLVSALQHQPQMSTKDIASLWKITPRTARLRLKQMVEQGMIVRIAASPKDPQAFFMLRTQPKNIL